MKYMKLKKIEDKVNRKDLKCKTNKYKYGFTKFETIRSFGDRWYIVIY